MCFCTVKEIINRVKKQSTEWETVFESHISDNGLVSKILKELLQLGSKQVKHKTKK